MCNMIVCLTKTSKFRVVYYRKMKPTAKKRKWNGYLIIHLYLRNCDAANRRCGYQTDRSKEEGAGSVCRQTRGRS